jgi:hypothetical protein
MKLSDTIQSNKYEGMGQIFKGCFSTMSLDHSFRFFFSAKKSAKPRKRTLPLTIPSEVTSEVCDEEGNEIDESSCFAILATNLPVTVINANKRMKKSNK